jgi:hypothetical protein
VVDNDFWRTHHTAAVCFVRALPEKESQEVLKGTKESLKIIDKDRECYRFTEWRQGFTPKEHREMQLSEDLRKWQEEQKRRDQEREDRLEKERESRRQDERERERQWLEQQRAKDQEREENNRRSQVK